MVIAVLLVLGLCLGSFANALIWRLHEQSKTGKKKPNKQYMERLSIVRGRSMCSRCHHELAPRDLIPVVSWLMLGGKCRYCHKPIADSPLIELSLPVLFVTSYLWWPMAFSFPQAVIFGLWLVLLVGLVALAVYDLRWMLLPDRLVFPLMTVAGLQALLVVLTANRPFIALLNVVGAVAVGGGLFYVLFQVSAGKWIGGGDVKLGWLLGLIVATPSRSLLFIFVAAVLGSLVALPFLWNGRLKRTSIIPFGPFLIVGAIVTQLFGIHILGWYQHMFLPFG